ncbi:hypothetical protein NDU88_001883 [Pleurodeles waltl]|uniref:Uncharacterized protein n=1 Tax=Pleurodeles waltl TaxID=8319 RepID=A0AAV7M2E8_PLEWA|nr:hypothetical protein NDU88_001883 [Pleurodeles waltl]
MRKPVAVSEARRSARGVESTNGRGGSEPHPRAGVQGYAPANARSPQRPVLGPAQPAPVRLQEKHLVSAARGEACLGGQGGSTVEGAGVERSAQTRTGDRSLSSMRINW